jgi:uncharacterized protein YjiS (DUF1127 family)
MGEVMTMVTVWDRTAGSGAPGSVRATPSGLSRLFALLCFWRVGEEQRQAAEPLDDHLLRDIGLTRTEFNLMSRAPKRHS